ncbi:MAG: murB [Herminiimonas sp.]|nr:murB [Herminiimonas sp.]
MHRQFYRTKNRVATSAAAVKRYNRRAMSRLASLQFDYPLQRLNTFGIACKAHAFLPVDSVEVLRAMLADPALRDLPRLVLGGGSNLLLTGDFPGLVLHLCNKGIERAGEKADSVLVRCAAGERWDDLVQWTLSHGLGGLENLSLIPGSVGASPIQNIGAYGAELADCFHSLRAFDLVSGEVLKLDRDACRFGYRDSIFKHELRERAVILSVTFALPKSWHANLRYTELARELENGGLTQPTPQQVSDAVIAIRTRKLPDPEAIGNAGSFFKNPVVDVVTRDALLAAHPAMVSFPQPDGTFKLAAGWLIDQCGWKGKSIGPAGVYEKQALVLVNRGGASGQQILALASAIQDDVQQRFGVRLEAEPVIV